MHVLVAHRLNQFILVARRLAILRKVWDWLVGPELLLVRERSPQEVRISLNVVLPLQLTCSCVLVCAIVFEPQPWQHHVLLLLHGKVVDLIRGCGLREQAGHLQMVVVVLHLSVVLLDHLITKLYLVHVVVVNELVLHV